MNSKQRRVAKRRADVYVGGFEMARSNCEAAARALRKFGLSIGEINRSLLRAASGKNAGELLAEQRVSPFPTQKTFRVTTP